jgi:hypothetical protein
MIVTMTFDELYNLYIDDIILPCKLNLTEYDDCIIRTLHHHYTERWCLYTKGDVHILINDTGTDKPIISTSDCLEDLIEKIFFSGNMKLEKLNHDVNNDVIDFFKPFTNILKINIFDYFNAETGEKNKV